MKSATKSEGILIIDTIRSAHNTGSMFRTGDGAGISKIILTGYTPAPADAKGKALQSMTKVSLGAEHMVPWEKRERIEEVIPELREKGYAIYALEKRQEARDIFSFVPHKRWALVVGHEVDGIPTHILDLCDEVLSIPMRGEKESLNVSVAVGVALYTLTRA